MYIIDHLLVTRLSRLGHFTLRSLLTKIRPDCVGVVSGRSNARYARALLLFICRFTRSLLVANDPCFFSTILTFLPYIDFELSSWADLLSRALELYFSLKILQILMNASFSSCVLCQETQK